MNEPAETEPRVIAWLYLIAALLSLIGLADAIYLTVEHLTGQSLRCTIISGCSEVLSSPYSHIGNLPLAALGAIAYFTVFDLSILAAFGYRFARPLLMALLALMFLMGKNGAVVIFIATRCPVSNAYNERMQKLAEDYKAKGINVIGINSNSIEPASEVKSHAAEKHLTFAILKDDGNKIADRLGATRTPEAYVLDRSGKLVYHGRIDNSQNTANITANDLRNALDEMLAGKQVTKSGGAAFGCTIKRVS